MKGRHNAELMILITMALGVLMDGIDGSIVNVALPTIAESFGTDTSTVSWVSIIYFMMMAGLLLPFGRVADSGLIKKIFMMGFAVFTAGSLMCGLSYSLEMLIVSRIIQGVGAAMIGAAAPMICVKMLPSNKLGRSLGVLSLASSGGFALGPALGGILVEYLSWHWIFFINVPIGVFAVLFGHYAMPSNEERAPLHMDVKGSALLFGAIAFGVFALERFTYPESREMCIISVIMTVILLAAFIIVELKTRMPMLSLRIFRDFRLDSVMISFMLINLVYMGVLYTLPFYMELELELNSSISGMILLIPSLITLIICIPVGKMSDVRGRRGFAIASSAMMVVFTTIFMFMQPEMGLLPLILAAVFMGLVWGFCGATSSSRIIDIMPDEDKGIGSAMINFLIYIGGTVGTALFASLMTVGAGSGGIPIDQLTHEAFMDGFTFSSTFAVAMSIVSLLTAWVVNENRKSKRKGAVVEE